MPSFDSFKRLFWSQNLQWKGCFFFRSSKKNTILELFSFGGTLIPMLHVLCPPPVLCFILLHSVFFHSSVQNLIRGVICPGRIQNYYVATQSRLNDLLSACFDAEKWVTEKYEPTYYWLFHSAVIPENFSCETCLRAARASTEKTACRPGGWSLPLGCQCGKQQQECLYAVGKTCSTHAVQARGVWTPRCEQHKATGRGSFHCHTQAHSKMCEWFVLCWFSKGNMMAAWCLHAEALNNARQEKGWIYIRGCPNPITWSKIGPDCIHFLILCGWRPVAISTATS